MATLTDISRETGLARTTVSEVLRGKAGYSEGARRRVVRAAERLGYRPNYLGQALRRGKSMTVGAIWPLRGVTGDVDIAMAVLEGAQERGYAIYQSEYPNDPDRLRWTVRELAGRRVDALLLWCVGGILESLREELKRLPAVVAVSDRAVADFAGDLVVHERLGAIGQVVEHLAATGRKRPAIVLSSHESQQHKIDHFQACCRKHGLDGGRVITLREPSYREEGGGAFDKPTLHPRLVAAYERTFAERFKAGVDVDAILCGTDQGAMTAMRFLGDRGVSVPADVAVIGWNNLPTGALWRPRLASIDRNQDRMIGALRELLLERLEAPEGPGRRRMVGMRFVWRESAGGAGESRIGNEAV